MSVLRSWEYWVGAAATLLWFWDIWRRRPPRLSPQSAPLGKVFAAAEIVDADFDEAVERLRAEIFGLGAHTRYAAADTVAAIGGFLDQMNRRVPRSLRHFNTVTAVQAHLRADAQSATPGAEGWSEEDRRRCIAAAERCLALPAWRRLVERDLASGDDGVFHAAAFAADALGQDCATLHWQRLVERPHDPLRWTKVLADADTPRTAAAVTLALQVLPLAQIAEGPDEGTAAPQPQDAALHDWLVVLDLLLQRLQDRPGLGRELLIAGFSGPFVRSRHLALSAFTGWAPDQRDDELVAALRRAAAGECVGSVELHFALVIAGLDGTAVPATQE